MKKNNKYMTTRQLADRFGVALNTIKNWIHSGKIKPTMVTPGGHSRFSEEDAQRIENQLFGRND